MQHGHNRILSLVFLVLLFSLVYPRNNLQNAAPQKTDIDPREMHPGRVLVKFAPGIHPGQAATASGIPSIDGLLRRFGVLEMRQLLPEAALRKPLVNTVGMDRIYDLRFRDGISPMEVAATLASDPNIEYAEPRYIYPLSDTPNDPSYGSMLQFVQVQAPAAWDVVKGSQGSVVIAVVDGGTEWNHQDLLDNIWNNSDEIAGNGIDDDDNGFVDDVRGWNFANDSNDPTGLGNTPNNAYHGTHTGGTIAAVTDNNLGVSSISWNAILMPINAGSASTDRAVGFGYDGIAYAAANGADIISCSWGSAGSRSQLEQDVINFAYSNGSLVVAAAGNSGINNDISPHYPSNYQHVLSVGATNQDSDVKAGFSNYGATVDVFAPGVGILSTSPNNGYASSSGTSMSTPMAAGLAGLIKTLQPGYTVDQMREQLRVSSDPIDNVNPALDGLLGKGRVNALRAVTDFSHPSIRIKDISFTESGGDEIIDAGETVDLQINFINYLASANNIDITLSDLDDNISINSANAGILSLNTDEVQGGAFQFSLSGGLPDGYTLRFYLDISAGSYSDREFFMLTVTPPRFATHNTGIVQTSITTEGNIGFTGFDGTPGVGFVHKGSGYFFEGGLMIGTGVNTVSDCVRGDDGSTQDNDFTPASGEELAIISPGRFTHEEGAILLTDSLAATPLGVSVLQQSYADNRSDNQEFVIFHYTLFNNNSTELNNVFVGLYFDWDVNSNAIDYARYDAARKTGYAMNDSSNPTRLAATRLLSGASGVTYRAIHNPDELYNGFTNSEKWNFLSGGVQTENLDDTDVSTLLGSGPYVIPANQSVEVVFAVIGASSIADLQQAGDNAQALWDNPTAIEPEGPGPALGFDLAQNYPNPFNPTTAISYTIGTRQLSAVSSVKLVIYNALGQQVKTLVSATQSTGRYTVQWDATDDLGQPVASGLYLYRIKAGIHVQVRKMLLLR